MGWSVHRNYTRKLPMHPCITLGFKVWDKKVGEVANEERMGAIGGDGPTHDVCV